MQRTNDALIERGYVTWFDLTNMKGSTMDAMSDAIEGADVMLYGVSLAYKESANCRLEASRVCMFRNAVYRITTGTEVFLSRRPTTPISKSWT